MPMQYIHAALADICQRRTVSFPKNSIFSYGLEAWGLADRNMLLY